MLRVNCPHGTYQKSGACPVKECPSNCCAHGNNRYTCQICAADFKRLSAAIEADSKIPKYVWTNSATLFEELKEGKVGVESSGVESVQENGHNLSRFVFTQVNSALFTPVAGAKLYTPSVTLGHHLLERMYREFPTLCCFSHGTRLPPKNDTLLRAALNEVDASILMRSARATDEILKNELINLILAASSPYNCSNEQIANFCSLTVQHGANPSLHLLSLIKSYMAIEMNVGIQGESAYIDLSKRKNKLFRSGSNNATINPRCTIEFKKYKDVFGFVQTLHSGFTRIVDDVERNMSLSPASGLHQRMNIFIQLFVPLERGKPVEFLALVVTAESSLIDIMLRLFQAISSGEFARFNMNSSMPMSPGHVSTDSRSYSSSDSASVGSASSFLNSTSSLLGRSFRLPRKPNPFGDGRPEDFFRDGYDLDKDESEC